MRIVMATMTAGALVLGGCGAKTPTLPDEPLAKAATCGIIQAASEREAAGAKGQLSAEAQGRIFQYPLLAASAGGQFDQSAITTVTTRMHDDADKVIKGKWQTLKPACATAFPATQISDPKLPEKPLDSMLQCYVLLDFMRKALGDQGSAYTEASTRYGVLVTKLDAKVSPALAAAGIHGGDALKDKRNAALAAVAKLGQPPAVISACEKKYG